MTVHDPVGRIATRHADLHGAAAVPRDWQARQDRPAPGHPRRRGSALRKTTGAPALCSAAARLTAIVTR